MYRRKIDWLQDGLVSIADFFYQYHRAIVLLIGMILLIVGGYLVGMSSHFYGQYIEIEAKTKLTIGLYQKLEEQINTVVRAISIEKGLQEPELLPIVKPYIPTRPTKIIIIGSLGAFLWFTGFIFTAYASGLFLAISRSRAWSWIVIRWNEDDLSTYIKRMDAPRR